jgi:hypothetical protein
MRSLNLTFEFTSSAAIRRPLKEILHDIEQLVSLRRLGCAYFVVLAGMTAVALVPKKASARSQGGNARTTGAKCGYIRDQGIFGEKRLPNGWSPCQTACEPNTGVESKHPNVPIGAVVRRDFFRILGRRPHLGGWRTVASAGVQER